MRRRWWTVIGLTIAIAMAAAGASPADTPKYGGVLNLMQREELPQGLSIHETSTIATVWPASPCFNNLVYFDPMKPTETADTIVGELAEKWSWQDGLPQSGLLPQEGRQVARRPAVHLEGREVHPAGRPSRPPAGRW